jgi:hypothetical protein
MESQGVARLEQQLGAHAARVLIVELAERRAGVIDAVDITVMPTQRSAQAKSCLAIR